MISLAKKNNAKLIYASTAGLYGNGPVPMKEDQEKEILSAYGRSKLEMDKIATELFDKMHIHPSHSFSWEMHHLAHDRVFWLIVGLICFGAFMTMLIAFGVWSSPTGGGTVSDEFYRYTF